jgi:uncharacterized membrane protein/uncharacterized protein YjeT (DUF2065 family)
MGTQQQLERTRTNQGWNGNGATRTQRGPARYSGTSGVVKPAPRHSSDVYATDRTPITNFLGWFSIGLGLAELLAPQAVARLVGVDEEEHTTLLRAYGMREIAAGVGILTRPKPTYWMWNRVVGDFVDLASLGRAMRSEENDKGKLRMASMAVLGVTALDIIDSMRLTSEKTESTGHDAGSFQMQPQADGNSVLSAAITVNRPIEEVYTFWKDPTNYSRFMGQMESVTVNTGGRSRWKIKAPAGMSVEWDAETVTDNPNELIRWRSTAESQIENTGSVRFTRAPGNRGTIVRLEVEFKPKAGPLGAKISQLFRAIPQTQLANDLRRFKQLIEIGEIVRSDATAVPKLMHAAQPPKREELEGRR